MEEAVSESKTTFVTDGPVLGVPCDIIPNIEKGRHQNAEHKRDNS
jgi:hypothetical protein